MLAGLLLLTACSPAGGQGSSKSAEFARAAFKPIPPAAQLSDQEFEALVANAGLRKAFGSRADEIIGQLKRTRVAVVPQPNLPGAAQERMVLVAASRPPAPQTGEGLPRSFAIDRGYLSLMNGFFAFILKEALDRFTQGQGGGGQIPPSTTTETEEGPTARTTTSLTAAADLGASGSRVQLTLHWTWRMSTVDKASGASMLEMVDDRTLKGAVDVCPSAAGIMAASLGADQQFSSTGSGGTRSRRDVRNNTFSGRVDDQAVLRGVTQELKDEASWESSSGDRGGFNISASQGWQGDSFSGTAGDAQLSYGLNGDAREADLAKQLSLNNGLDLLSIQDAIQEAERLWRHGRCVVVTAPDYTAETPISTADQEKMQHDQKVDKGSVTKFGASLRHRFGGGLNHPVDAKLTSGDKKLEPGRLGSVPGKLSYTAPDERDKKAAVQLKSVSKRGIGTLVLGFNTESQRLSIVVKGTITATTGPLVLGGSYTIGPVEFTSPDGKVSEQQAPMQGTARGELPEGDCREVVVSETGSVLLIATTEKRGDTSVWVVKEDPARSKSTITGSGCGASFTQSFESLGLGIAILGKMGDIVIPIDGGTVPLRKTWTVPQGVTYVVDATLTATVKKS